MFTDIVVVVLCVLLFSRMYVSQMRMKNVNTCIENSESEVHDEMKRKIGLGCF
jgi:hypothetical protein